MLKEYWINVYGPIDWDSVELCNGLTEIDAKYYLRHRARHTKNKTLYRIHVKMKPKRSKVHPDYPDYTWPVKADANIEYKITVTGDCGQPHTFVEWQKCKACEEVKFMLRD